MSNQEPRVVAHRKLVLFISSGGAHWSLPNSVGKQREVLALRSRGHFVILGTAGSGKTTLAILRASILPQTACSNQEKVLLITFNKALVTYLKEICDGELGL